MVKTITQVPSGIVHTKFEIGHSNWDAPQHLALSQLKMDSLFSTVAIEASEKPLNLPAADQSLDLDSFVFDDPLHPGRQMSATQFLDRRVFNDALMIIRRGELVHESYRNGMCAQDRHVLHSCTKSLCAMLVAIAVDEGRMQREATIDQYIEPLRKIPAWQGVTLQQVLDMQAGIAYSEDYTDPDAHYWHYARAAGYYPPLPGEQAIGVRGWILANLTEREHAPGTRFAYNSCLANILGMALEHVYDRGLDTLFEEKLYQRVGAEVDGYFNTDRMGFPIVEGQLNLRLRDFARLSLLLANGGRNLAGEQVLPADFIVRITNPDPAAQNAYQAGKADELFPSAQYKEQFWVLDPDRSQFAMLGIHGQFAWYDLERELLIVGYGSYPVQDGSLKMTALNTLWQTIAACSER